MNGKTKNKVVALLAGATALCLGGAIACYAMSERQAYAAEEVSYEAFVNIGATETATAADTALGLTEKGATASVAGTVTEGDTLFGSYATGATYTVTASAAGEYQVAVAIKAEAGKTLKINGEAVSFGDKTGNTVVTATKSGTSFEVSYDGALCGVLVAAKDSKVLMTADYTPGQVISYGKEIAPQLDKAMGYYSDGTSEELAIEYGEINAGTGVNVNFTTIDVTGTVAGTNVTVTRYLTTMPDDLIYFINCGSSLDPEPTIVREDFPTDAAFEAEQQATIDGYYSYNQTVFDYYGKENLINYGTPDRTTTKGGDWGYYTNAKHFAPGDATFPYNSAIWTGGGNGVTDMGYMLSGLNASESYRVWFGTLSHWHARTTNITFNDQTIAGQETLRIPSSKSFTVFENIKPDANGKVDIHMTQVGSQNEPTLCFIAVQKMSTELPAAPSAPQGSSMVGMSESSMRLTNVTAGAALRLYNAAKPNQLLYEETVDGEKIAEDGSYTVEWEGVFEVSQFRIVQVTAGGVSDSLLVSITDITDFKASLASEGYTTAAATVLVEAQADSGIVSWSYKLGEYGEVNEFATDRPYKLEASFEAVENGDYYIVVTSGLGVTYSEVFTVNTIDANAPVISLTPSKAGWSEGSYNVDLTVTSVAPVTEYKLYKDGKEMASAASAPASIAFTETGEYVISVKTAAGLASVSALRVSEKPVTTVVRKSFEKRQLSYSFGDSVDYTVYSVTAYQLLERGALKMTISGGNTMDVYDEGTYVVTVTTTNGAVEMFALTVDADDLKGENTGVVDFTASGCGSVITGSAAAIGAVILAGVVSLVLLKKKKS